MASESWIKLFVFCVHLSVVWCGDVIYVKLSQQKVVGAPRCSPRTGQNPIVLHTSPAWPGLGPGCMWPTAGKQLTHTNILWDNGLILWHGDTWHVTRGFRQPTLGKTQIMTQLRERETMPSTKSHPTSCLLFPAMAQNTIACGHLMAGHQLQCASLQIETFLRWPKLFFGLPILALSHF